MKLVNSNVSQLFTVPQAMWKEVNQRVGFVLHVHHKNQQGGDAGWFIVPWPSEQNYNNLQRICNDTNLGFGIRSTNVNKTLVNGQLYLNSEWCIGTNTPSLLAECQNWRLVGFLNLLGLATEVAIYNNRAVSNFQNILNLLKQSNNTITPEIVSCTQSSLQELNKHTAKMQQDIQSELTKLKTFVTSNKVFDQFFMTNSFLISMLNVPQFQPQSFQQIDTALESMLGAWSAMANDIASIADTKINVTLPFLMSLDIQAAITSWQNIAQEAQNFAQSGSTQEQYWDYHDTE